MNSITEKFRVQNDSFPKSLNIVNEEITIKKSIAEKLNSFFVNTGTNVLRKLLKANHLAYIAPRWYGSRISADCQQKLLFTKHDTSEKFLQVTFLEKQKKEDVTQR